MVGAGAAELSASVRASTRLSSKSSGAKPAKPSKLFVAWHACAEESREGAQLRVDDGGARDARELDRRRARRVVEPRGVEGLSRRLAPVG